MPTANPTQTHKKHTWAYVRSDREKARDRKGGAGLGIKPEEDMRNSKSQITPYR